MGIVFVLLLGEIDLSVGFVSGVGGVDRPRCCCSTDGNASRRRPRRSSSRSRAGVGDRHAARPAHHEDRDPVVRRDARRPAGLERRRAAAHRRRAAPSSSRTSSSSASPTTSSRRRGVDRASLAASALYAATQLLGACAAPKARACRPTRCCSSSPARRRPARWSLRDRRLRRQRGPRAARTSFVLLARAARALDVRAAAGRSSGATSTRSAATPRRRGARASTSTASRSRCFAICSMMAALGGIVLASRLRSVDTDAGGGSILLYSIAAAVIGGTSLFGGRGHIKSARARRARDRVDRQRARPARPELGDEVRRHRPGAARWPSPSTRSRAGATVARAWSAA